MIKQYENNVNIRIELKFCLIHVAMKTSSHGYLYHHETILEASTMDNTVKSLVYIVVSTSTEIFKCFNVYYTIYCKPSLTQFIFLNN